MSVRSLCFATLLATSLVAQTPPCVSYNDASTSTAGGITAFSFNGNARAYQFQVTQTTVLFGAQVFTENTFLSGEMSLEIYDSNFIFQPGMRLGGGVWQAGGPLGLGWQGCNFDQPVVLNAGPTYWLVWRDPGFSEIPEESGGTGVPWSLWNGTSWATQPFLAFPKWRGFCSGLDSANVQSIGLGCPNSAGSTPTQFTNFEPSVGNADFRLETSGNLPDSLGLIVLGTDPAWPSIPFALLGPTCEVHSDLVATEVITCNASGYGVFEFPIPGSAAIGLLFNSQFAMLDVALTSPLPFAMTNGLRWTTF